MGPSATKPHEQSNFPLSRTPNLVTDSPRRQRQKKMLPNPHSTSRTYLPTDPRLTFPAHNAPLHLRIPIRLRPHNRVQLEKPLQHCSYHVSATISCPPACLTPFPEKSDAFTVSNVRQKALVRLESFQVLTSQHRADEKSSQQCGMVHHLYLSRQLLIVSDCTAAKCEEATQPKPAAARSKAASCTIDREKTMSTMWEEIKGERGGIVEVDARTHAYHGAQNSSQIPTRESSNLNCI